MSPPDADWWRRAVIYQIYPKSYADGSGDGVGDLPGIISRLDHLARLGVDAIWLSPFYRGPQRDGGYDVADHRDVDPLFGTLGDAERLIAEAHRVGIRVIVDVVPNHTSSEHRFFREALASPPGSAAWARYHCVRGRGPDGASPPNDWMSIFGGIAWTPIADGAGVSTGWWYLHLFDAHQPDVNWAHPDVVAEFDATLRFWFDRGVDGCRIDVAHGLVKAAGYPDVGVRGDGSAVASAAPYFDQPGVHEIYRRWRAIADEYAPPRIFVAEAWLDAPDKRSRYLRPDELHTGFNFDLLVADWDATAWRAVVDASLAADAAVGAPTTWVTENHDVRRAPTRYGGRVGHREVPTEAHLARGRRRSLGATLTMLALPGSSYLYNGQELGLDEIVDLPDAVRQDPTYHRTRGATLGRDGCRVPLPWRRAGTGLGFSGDREVAPWLPQPARWAALSVEAQEGDPDSTLERTRRAIAARRGSGALLRGGFAWAPELAEGRPDVLAFRRTHPAGDVVCVANMGEAPLALPAWPVLAASHDPADGALAPDATAWLSPRATGGRSSR